MDSVTPFLWIQHPVDEAVAYYREVFDDFEVESPDPAIPTSATVLIGGQRVHLFNAGPMEQLTTAFSLMVLCETQQEIDRLWDGLGDGGSPIQCGWVTDRFGVTWQIVPRDLLTWLSDPERGQAVTQAMLQMQKLEIGPLMAALHD